MRGMHYASLNITGDYGLKEFHGELKSALQIAGIENTEVVLYIEDHQMFLSDVLECANSLLSSGEVPGLYTHEELEPLLAPLREEMQDVGGFRTPYAFFVSRIQRNLHIVIGMDHTNENFSIRCESNPALYTRCSIVWMGEWTRASLMKVPEMLVPEIFNPEVLPTESKEGKEGVPEEDFSESQQQDLDCSALLDASVALHETMLVAPHAATPRDFVSFLKCYHALFSSKAGGMDSEIKHLKSGLSKLQEAADTVDKLSAEAGEKAAELKVKQDTADRAMDQITTTLASASDRRKEVEVLRVDMQEEKKKTEAKKAKIQDELKDVQPLLEQAKEAVSGIRSDNLNEIRSLKMPPEAIHDVLSAVLMLLGIRDTSWLSMKKFLQNRGVKDQILHYDAHNLTPETRKQVSKILRSKASSFDDANIYRVSVAAAPMAAWVKANVRFSLVLEKIKPLERDLDDANRMLQRAQDRVSECEEELATIDDKVAELW